MASSHILKSNTKTDNPEAKLILNTSPIKSANTDDDAVLDLKNSAEKESNLSSSKHTKKSSTHKHKNKKRTPSKSATHEKSEDVVQEANLLSDTRPPSQYMNTMFLFNSQAKERDRLFELAKPKTKEEASKLSGTIDDKEKKYITNNDSHSPP